MTRSIITLFFAFLSLCILGSCHLWVKKSQLRSSSDESAEKAILETIALGLSYPYERESGSYLFVNGIAYPYEYLGKDPLADSTIRMTGKVVQVDTLLKNLEGSQQQLRPEPMNKRIEIIAYGSNAAVSALNRKFMSEKFLRGWAIFPVLKGTLREFEVVHAAHFVPVNGSFPAGLAYSPGAESEVWMTFLDEEEMKRMHASEGIDSDSPESWYSYGKLEKIRVHIPGWKELTSAFVYIDNFGSLKINGRAAALTKVPGSPRSPKVSMPEALKSVEDIFKKNPASSDAQKKCARWGDVEQRICENIVDPCARDARSNALLSEKRVLLWNLPEDSGIKFTRLAGSDKAGHPRVLPDILRCTSN